MQTTENDIPKNVDGYPSEKLFTESKIIENLYLRTSAPNPSDTRANPFVNMNMAMVPYCTGDSHVGNKVRYWKYTDENNVEQKKYFFFAGDVNFKKALTFYKSIYPSVTTIYLMGASAGAGGAVVQYESVREKWPAAQVHLLEDAVPVVPDPLDPLKSIVTWQADLPGCDDQVSLQASSVSSRRAKAQDGTVASYRATKATRYTAKHSSRGATLNVSSEDSGPLPYPEWFGPASPFLAESGETLLQSGGQMQPMDIDPDPSGEVPTGSCKRLQQTREYIRATYPDFRYGIMSFRYDNVLKPQSVSYADYDAAISTAAANVKSKGAAALTHSLFVDNTRVDASENPNTFKPCGRHVVTNFNNEPFYLDGQTLPRIVIQDAHYGFITRWISGVGWSDVALNLDPYGCPTAVNDGFLVVF